MNTSTFHQRWFVQKGDDWFVFRFGQSFATLPKQCWWRSHSKSDVESTETKEWRKKSFYKKWNSKPWFIQIHTLRPRNPQNPNTLKCPSDLCGALYYLWPSGPDMKKKSLQITPKRIQERMMRKNLIMSIFHQIFCWNPYERKRTKSNLNV